MKHFTAENAKSAEEMQEKKRSFSFFALSAFFAVNN
jgi:hypothetical protein